MSLQSKSDLYIYSGSDIDQQSIRIAGKDFVKGFSPQHDKELFELQEIVEREKGHAQFVKQGICIFLIVCVILMNLLLENGSSPSIIGIKHCSFEHWLIQATFIAICFCIAILAVKMNRREQKLKMKYDVNISKNEIKFKGKELAQLTSIGFVGGFVAGALGLGGGSIYNPALLTMGVHPKVSSATGMYLVLFSTINTCLFNYLNGFLNPNYALWIGVWSVLGSFMGMRLTDRVVQMTGKASIIVWVLVFVFVLSTIATPIFGGIDLMFLYQRGEDIFAFQEIC